VLAAIMAAMLAGAASASAETGSGADAGDTKTSEAGAADSKPDSTKPDSTKHDAESTGDEQKPTIKPKRKKTHVDDAKPSRSEAVSKISTTAAPKSAQDTQPKTTTHETSTPASESTATAKSLEPATDETPVVSKVMTTLAAHTSVAVAEQAPTPRKPNLINFVGTIAMNVVMGLIHTFDGAPVLPAGSTVTVRTSTLTIPVAGGRTVQADWYFPDNDGQPPTRLIYFQHGLGASGPMYSYTAATLAEKTNSIVVAPSLTSNFFDADGAWLGGAPMQQGVADLFIGDRAALTESASAAAGHEVTLPTRFVLAGHSLGGSLVMGAAGDMVDNGAIDDLAGVLLLDSVDVGNSVPTALQRLTEANYVPVYDISSERYVWNMYGAVGDELEAARPGQFNGVMLVGGRHIDALQGANPLLQLSEYLVAGFSQPQNIEAVKTLAAGWVNDMFAGTHDGIYGAPQQTIEIDTPKGTATAVVLPFTSTQRVQGTPFDGVLSLVLNVVTKFFVYEPLAGRAEPVTT
jgi:acetyl esterase/lipase